MLRLTREVRFAVNAAPDDQLRHRPANSYAGYPSLTGLGQHFAVQVTVAGEADARTGYLLNIKDIDNRVRELAIPELERWVRDGSFAPCDSLRRLHGLLDDAWKPAASLHALRLLLTPFLSCSVSTPELPMVKMSQKFEFSASHRLHSPTLSEEQNRKVFGKCNNPHGHGHNYEVQVTLVGEPGEHGLLVEVPAFERVVASSVIDRFDHKNLNVELPEFRELIPSVENIAKVIWRILKPQFDSPRARLASVTVWETTKTWCEYSESDHG